MSRPPFPWNFFNRSPIEKAENPQIVSRSVRHKQQPWRLSAVMGKVLKNVSAPSSEPMIRPVIYGRDAPPPADDTLENFHAPSSLKLSAVNNVTLLSHHVAVSEDSEVLKHTFLRGRWKHHGGVMRLKDEEELYKTKHNSDLTTHLNVDDQVFWADTDKPYVYGHVLLEAIPSLWGLAHAPRDIRIATSVKPNRSYLKMFEAMGVDAQRLLHITYPVVAKEVLFPSLPVVRRSWIHPIAWEVFDRLKVLARESTISSSERIYLSRSKLQNGDRELANENEIESIFEEFGFSIIHPQDLLIEDQIKLFTEAKMIAGSGGSATHNALFSGENTKVLIVCSSGWMVNADTLLSQVPGRLGYVFGDPLEVPQDSHRTQGKWSVDPLEVRRAIERHFDL